MNDKTRINIGNFGSYDIGVPQFLKPNEVKQPQRLSRSRKPYYSNIMNQMVGEVENVGNDLGGKVYGNDGVEITIQ